MFAGSAHFLSRSHVMTNKTITPCRVRLITAVMFGMFAVPVSAQAPESAPPTEMMRVAGLEAPAEIRLDRWGVPHIYAGSEADLFFVQGFNAARDRLFQIDLWRRRGLGQLAEVLGPGFIEQDRAARLFLYRGDMDREWRIYSSRGTREAERIAQRFVAGVNAYIDWLAKHRERLPWEFKRLGYHPAKWAAEDVVRIRSHGLTRNLLSEVARANTLCKTGQVEVDQIRSGLSNHWKAQVPEGLDPCLPDDVLKVFRLATQGMRLTTASAQSSSLKLSEVVVPPGEEPAPEGSNNWVVAPRKSATGRAILANDPHRAYSVPSLRYMVHLSAPGIDIVGAGEPALPGISIGHNGTIAFGLTIFNIDQEDLYVYEINPADPMQYRYEGGWEPFRVLREEIRIKEASPQTSLLTFTRHGPVIYVDAAKKRAYAVRSGWLEPGMSPYFGSLDYLRAKDFKAFQRSLLNWGAPTLNHLYADVKGNIGWASAGLAPKRPNWDGLLPVPGDGRYEWDGFWRGDELPRRYNPPQGWIATANAYNIPPGYPATERKLGFEWANPSRHERVHEVLGGLNRISLEDCERLQTDILSIPARRLVALLAPLKAEEEKGRRALELLRGWDAREQSESPQAALFEVWQSRHLRQGFREAVLPPASAAALSGTDMDVMLGALEQPSTRFGERAAEKRDRLLLTTLDAAYAEMEKLQGPDPRSWRWGKLHHNFAEHPFAAIADEATRSRVNVGPLPKDGSEYTPNQSSYRADDFRQTNGPSLRVVIDVGDWDNSRAVNHPGQSGDPASGHYRDLAPLWHDGRYFPLLYSRKAVARQTERIIRLVPDDK
jgi:penicillin amidase